MCSGLPRLLPQYKLLIYLHQLLLLHTLLQLPLILLWFLLHLNLALLRRLLLLLLLLVLPHLLLALLAFHGCCIAGPSPFRGRLWVWVVTYITLQHVHCLYNCRAF